MASHRLLLVQPAVTAERRSGPHSSGIVRTVSPGIPVLANTTVPLPACLALLVNVAYLALLVYVAYVENIALAASCPGQAAGAGRTIVRGGRRPYARGSPVRKVFLAPFPGVKLPPALRGRSRAACSWSSRPRDPALPAGCAPEGSGRGRGSAAVVDGPWFRRPFRPLSRRSDWRTRRSVLGEYPWPRIAQRAFVDVRPARRGGRGRIRPSSRFEASDLRLCTARQRADVGVYDRYRLVVTSRRIVYNGCIVRIVLLVHVRYVALLVNVGGVPSVSMMISPVHLARVEMRTVPCSVCRDLYGCGNCPSWGIVR